MGFLYKHFIHPFLSSAMGRRAASNNPYLCLIIDAPDSEVIADEQFRIGLAYKEGAYMLPQDDKKALSYVRKAAERGHAVAQVFMAMGCMKHDDDSNEEVLYWLQKAAEQGERQALYNIGISYHRGDFGGKVDVAKSNECFRQSAEAGYVEAFLRMALIYLNGEGVEKNLKIAKYWAMLDFASVPPESRDGSVLGQLLEPEDTDEENHLNAGKITEEAVEAGERDAMNRWAKQLLRSGEKEKAMALLKKAADLKHPEAMVHLAHLCSTELKDYEQARTLLEEAAKSGNEHAWYGLAEIYYQGLGVDQNVSQAWVHLERAINKGDTPSRFLFATMCLNNDLQEILSDKVMRGISYLEQAAQDNYEPALEYMAKARRE